MISFYKPKEGRIEKVSGLEPDCWIEVQEPRVCDLAFLILDLGIADEFIKKACDDKEASHIDYDDATGQVLVVVDCPFKESDSSELTRSQYSTHPLAFIFLPDKGCFVTFSLTADDTVASFRHTAITDARTHLPADLLLRMLLTVTNRYLADLRSISSQIRKNEDVLRHTMDNDVLISMLGAEKSLIHFSMSLQELEATVKLIGTGRVIPLHSESGLLDDLLIEVHQAVAMCDICTRVLNGVSDTFSNVMSNNLNKTMQTLTVLTLILSIPAAVFGFYGMNVARLPFVDSWVPALLISLAISALAIAILKGRRLIK